MILAVDTSIGTGVSVVGLDGVVRAEAESPNALGHAEVIGTLLERALADAGATPADVAYVAAGMGPGPFTGLRIGIAAARAFAIGRGVPVLPIASHDAAALAQLDDDPQAIFAVVTDARRREVAVSVYRGLDANGLPVRAAGPELRPVAADLSADPLLAAAGAPAIHEVTRIPSGALGRLAALRIAAGLDGDEPEPLYLRSPDVKAPAPRKRVGS
jgi:tRNA threonylcarbamoyl adenosine modification protein YeaZ